MCCTATRISNHNDCICDAGHHPHFHRRFLSTDERIARLTEYKDDLSREIKEIENHIASIRNE